MKKKLLDTKFVPEREMSQQLIRELSDVYPRQGDQEELLGKIAGLSPADLAEQGNARQKWQRVLTKAADRQLLRELVETALEDSPGLEDRLPEIRSVEVEVEEADLDEPQEEAPMAETVLEDTMWDLVGRLLGEHVLGTGNAVASLQQFLPREFVGELGLGDDPDKNLRLVVNALKATRVEGANSDLALTLGGLLGIDEISDGPEGELLQAELERVNSLAAQRPGDPLYSFLFPNQEVFIDRRRLRDGLKKLLGSERAFVVRGEAKTGKSYSLRLIRHIAPHGGFDIAKVRHFEADDAKEFINFLTEQIDPDLEHYKGTKDSAKWGRHASSWLVRQALEHGGNWWFVVDGFNRDNSSSQLTEIISSLCLYVAEAPRGKLRLILIDYDGALPHELGRPKEEKLTLLQPGDLRELFVDFFATPRNGVQPGEEALHVEAAVGSAWQNAKRREEAKADDDADKSFMHLLKEEVENTLHGYL